MRTLIPFILSTCLIIVFTFFLTEKGFSQTDQKDKADTSSNVSVSPDVTSSVPKGITPGRARSLIGGVFGLIGVIVGWRAKILSTKGTRNVRPWGITAMILALVCMVLSMVHLATTSSGFGTGGGKAGAIVGLILGLIAITLSGLALRTKKQN